jgi:serine/threonine protein kinase
MFKVSMSESSDVSISEAEGSSLDEAEGSKSDGNELYSRDWEIVPEDMVNYPHLGPQQPMIVAINAFGTPSHKNQFDFICKGYTNVTHRYRVIRFYAKGGEGEAYECVRFPSANSAGRETRFCLKSIFRGSAMTQPIRFELEREFLSQQVKAAASRNTVQHYCAHVGPFQNASAFHGSYNPFKTDLGYMLMQLLPNNDFFAVIESKRTMPDGSLFAEADAKFFVKGLMNSLAHLHDNLQNVHRDLAFDNIMLDRYGNLVLIDYGRVLQFQRKPADWAFQDIKWTKIGGGTTGKPQDFFAWSPEYLNSLWKRGGDIKLAGGRFTLSKECPFIKDKIKIDLRKTDVWIAGNILLYILIGSQNASNLILTAPCGGLLDASKRVCSPTAFNQRINYSKTLSSFRSWFCQNSVELSDMGLNFLRRIFTDADSRATAAELLRDPWLADVSEQMPESLKNRMYEIQPEMGKRDSIRSMTPAFGASPMAPAFGASPMAPAFGASLPAGGDDVTANHGFEGESMDMPEPFAPTNARKMSLLPAHLAAPAISEAEEEILTRLARCLSVQVSQLEAKNAGLKAALVGCS